MSQAFREPESTDAVARANAVPPLARMPEEWEAWARGKGLRPYQGRQIFEWIHKRVVTTPSAMSNVPAPLRAALEEEGMAREVSVRTAHRSADGTRKWLVALADDKTVETVLIPGVSGHRGVLSPAESAGAKKAAESAGAKKSAESAGAKKAAAAAKKPGADADDASDSWGMGDLDEDDEDEQGTAAKIRVTQCISSQVGCAMGCVFCASGVAGLERHLGPHEIVGQVIAARAGLDPDERLSNVVYMGMGEPLHNYAAVARSLRLLTHEGGLALSKRRVTVSTSGLVPEIERLGKDFQGQIGLAISLHAADDETRGRLMPINRKYPLPELMAALARYPLPRRRRITIEYTLVAGKNDTVAEAERLAKLLRTVPVKVNLIPMNPIEASSLGPPDLSGVLRFQQALIERGYACFVRRRRGDDVSAACGQLALEGRRKKVRVIRD